MNKIGMKKIKIVTITLAIILITMIAFFGIYSPVQNRMENKVKNYSYAMDLKGARTVVLKVNKNNKTVIKDAEGKEVSDGEGLTDEQLAEKGYKKEETPYNNEEILTKENYKKTKEIIEKRLKKLNADQYVIKVNEETGDITVELTENDNTDSIVSNLNTTGKFEIIDSETKEVLMDNNDIKLANVLYGSNSTSATSTGTSVYLNIEFNKDGAKKLEDISNKYVKVENTDNTTTEDTNTTGENATTGNTTEGTNATTENAAEGTDTTGETTADETKTTEKKITMKIDDEEIMSTSFDEPLKTGKLQLSIGQASTDTDTLQGYVDQASSMATVLDTGNIPVKYSVDENEYVASDITRDQLQIIKYTGIAFVAIAIIVLCVIYKMNGFIGAISYVGLFSLLMLLIRYTNVVLSIEGLVAIALVLILEYIFINRILTKIKQESKGKMNRAIIKEAIKDTYKEFFVTIIPIAIAIITFCFAKWTSIGSFGMVMFWGISLIAIYNFAIVGSLLKIETDKE